MHTIAKLAELRSKLTSIPQHTLAEAVCEYASFDSTLFDYLSIVCELSGGNCNAAFELLRGRIDKVFSADFGSGSLKHEDRVPFFVVHELLSLVLVNGHNKEVMRLAELTYTYAENLSVVHWPDTFLEDCYEPIIAIWVKGQQALGRNTNEIGTRVQLLAQYDQFHIFSSWEKHLNRP